MAIFGKLRTLIFGKLPRFFPKFEEVGFSKIQFRVFQGFAVEIFSFGRLLLGEVQGGLQHASFTRATQFLAIFGGRTDHKFHWDFALIPKF